MYTDSLLAWFIRIVRYTNWLGCLPYRIDTTRGKLYIHPWSHFRTFHVWSWATAYAVIVLPTHLYQLYCMGQTRRFNFTVQIWIGASGCSLLTGIFTWYSKGNCQIINSLFKLLPDFASKYMSEYDFSKDFATNKLLEGVLLTLYTIVVALGYLASLDCFIRPTAPPYPLFNIEKQYVSWTAYLVSCCWYTSFALGFFALVAYLLFIAIFYFYYSSQIIGRELRMGRRSYKTTACLRENPYELVKVWQTFGVLTKCINMELGQFILFLQIVCRNCCIFSAIVLVYQWKRSGIVVRSLMMFLWVVALTVWSLILIVAGTLYKWSLETLQSWKQEYWCRKVDWNYMKRAKKACLPLSIGDGKRYFVTPVSVLMYIKGVSKNTFMALITYADVMGYN